MFIQKIKEDKKKEYIKVHEECWPELLRAIKESGIIREMIWLHENNILIYMMSENFDKSIAKLAKKKVFKDWNDKMSLLLDEMQDYSEEGKIIRLVKIFDLEMQLGELKKVSKSYDRNYVGGING